MGRDDAPKLNAREFAEWFIDRPERWKTRDEAVELLTRITAERDQSWRNHFASRLEDQRPRTSTGTEVHDAIAESHGHAGKPCWLGCCDPHPRGRDGATGMPQRLGMGNFVPPGKRCTGDEGHSPGHVYYASDDVVGRPRRCPYVEPPPSPRVTPPDPDLEHLGPFARAAWGASPGTPEGPRCQTWCGTEDGPLGKSWHGPADRNDYCTPACRDAGRPLHPGTPSTPRGSR